MNKPLPNYKLIVLLFLMLLSFNFTKAQIIISQYYEGTGTNKWIELTNTSNSTINTASPQLKLGLWSVTGSTGNIAVTGAPSSTVNLTVTIPAFGSVLIGNTGNGSEISYLTAASAAQTSNTVINFNGNDGIALLDANNNIIDQFGTGINATDISYTRLTTIATASATFVPSQWNSASIATVQAAATNDPNRLGFQLANLCVAPTTQATNLAFSTPTSTSISGSFTPTTADEYLILYSTSASLSSNPSNGTAYQAGNTIGNATVLYRGTSATFSASALASSTTYYFYVFALNSVGCNGGPTYQLTNPLNGNATTLAPPCVTPANQPTALQFGTPTSTAITASYTPTTADEYLVVYSTAASLSANPVNGTSYSAGNTLGNANVLYRGSNTTFSTSTLSPSTTYYFYVFALNSTACSAGPVYQTTAPLSGNITTLAPPCVAPAAQPTALTFTSVTSSVVSASFTATTANEYLVLCSTAATLSSTPSNGTIYNTGNTLGNATVVGKGSSTNFTATGLNPVTTYYFYIFALNSTSCSAGPVYNTTAPLTGSTTTPEAPLYFFFGNFHSHSQYSDGSGLPSGDFAFGDTANCMDFLGISEHNHVSAGMSLSNYALGRSQAQAATTPSFLAMYGMEWGVISGGGHVVVYGVDKLIGWDAGQYDIYVPQSVYTGTGGLFSVINGYSSSNAFATLAHPNNTDYNGIMSTYDAAADDAVVGAAVENGPSTSTDVTYTDPPSSMLYLSFYRNMLSKGYHLGPTMDHDNHNVTHGHTSTTRTVVLSPTLTEKDVLASMRLMRFYATEDCSAYVTFKINNKPLGTIMTAAGAPTITVSTSTSNPVTSLKIYSGVPGSGSNATILTSTTTGSITFTHTALANLSSRYYYIDITESDGKRIVTAPIWYSRNDAAKMSNNNFAVAEFFAVAEPKKVLLKWITTNEGNSSNYTIEKSLDGINFQLLDTQIGKGNSPYPQNYITTDTAAQNDAIVYYRLTERDNTGAIIFADTKKVEKIINSNFELEAFPNPIADNTKLQINNTIGEKVNIEIYDITGQLVHQQSLQTIKGDQEIELTLSNLKTGVYFLTAKSDNYNTSIKITKL